MNDESASAAMTSMIYEVATGVLGSGRARVGGASFVVMVVSSISVSFMRMYVYIARPSLASSNHSIHALHCTQSTSFPSPVRTWRRLAGRSLRAFSLRGSVRTDRR